MSEINPPVHQVKITEQVARIQFPDQPAVKLSIPEIRIVALGQQGIPGPQGVPGTGGDLTYVHTQGVASTTWTVNHNLGKYPTVTIMDSAGDEVEGDISYVSANTLTLTFHAAMGGVAYLN